MLAALTMKLSSQHRALYCYLILSVWIFLLVAGMYKYIGIEEPGSALKHAANEVPMRKFNRNIKPDIKMRRIFRLCNPPEEIGIGNEGQVQGNYSLEGVLIFLRHGDRGPLAHIRNISNVNCAGDLISSEGLDSDFNFRTYEFFLQNLSSSGKLAGFLPQFLGPFHGFPLLPPINGECLLGQMTPVGVAQILKTGHILRLVYGERLGIGNGSLSSDDMIVYSTRYRRTFQSAVAFLYTFLSSEDFQKVMLRESQSLAFCFNDCACPAVELFRRKFATESTEHLQSHPAVVKLVHTAATIVFEMAEKSLLSDPHALRDALLAYVCHGAQLPCLDDECVRMEQVTGLFAYTEWEARQYSKSSNLKRSCLLRAYGMVRDIVSHMLRIISEKKPKFVLYSGHDKTLQYLTTALGIISDTTAAPHYASRLIMEVYKNKEQESLSKKTNNGPVARNYYFRLVYNGRDITNHVHFCKGGNNIMVMQAMKTEVSENTKNSSSTQSQLKKQIPAYLCPIESIVRFLHDDYFISFNGTNFKDVCSVHS
ncbi:2-phosphoxylose phosphatase 1 [Anabrus simplex]|uniref:2-phosphoxylose phosphatase 1 n=1 Tax=Anabrus simplex TaxID=316456 RepID=UPI0034DD4080